MATQRPPRPNILIDALEAATKKQHRGTVWRVVRDSRNVLLSARPGGRWDDGTFDVLYTSAAKNGAIAEIYFHLSKGQPVIPSRVDYFVHEIEVSLNAVVDLSRMSDLADLGVDIDRFGRLSYMERQSEYISTQQIAEVAHFLECDGILVPNMRWDCLNLVVFMGRTSPDRLAEKGLDGPIDWVEWQKNPDRNPTG